MTKAITGRLDEAGIKDEMLKRSRSIGGEENDACRAKCLVRSVRPSSAAGGRDRAIVFCGHRLAVWCVVLGNVAGSTIGISAAGVDGPHCQIVLGRKG